MEIYNLDEDHIFYSREISFADGIKRMTGGRGVDVVLNSLSGDGVVASWGSVAPFGCFLEIGRRNIDLGRQLPMVPFIKTLSFISVACRTAYILWQKNFSNGCVDIRGPKTPFSLSTR